MRVMVTGSRGWTDRGRIREAFGKVVAGRVVLVHGDCRGADRLAAEVALELGWDVVPRAADWEGPCAAGCPPGHRRARGGQTSGATYCPNAGRRRNQEMVDARPDVVFAFPTARSVGTWDAVRRARRAGIRVEVASVA